MKLHLDTDFGGDPDDACALAMLLAWPDVEITGITTNLDMEGERAGCVDAMLRLAGRTELCSRVVAGATASMTDGRAYRSTATDPRYWEAPVAPLPSPPEVALAALDAAIDRGDTIVTIGALTNLAALEMVVPGRLRSARVVTMGGWVRPTVAGLPPWGPERDFNMQCDVVAADTVVKAVGDLTLVTLPAAATAHLRRAHLDRLGATGPIGQLLARQSEAYAVDSEKGQLASAFSGLPDDLVNFHWDPVTCAVALGWDRVVTEDLHLLSTVEKGVIHLREARNGIPVKVVVEVDGSAFGEAWLSSLEGGRVR